MELKDFISSAIYEIASGVADATKKCKDLGVVINPNITTGSQGDYCIPKNPENVIIQRRVQIIEMDIAVVVTQSTQKNGEGRVNMSVISVGGDICKENSTVKENRVRFSLPVCLPVTDVLRDGGTP